LKTSSSRKVFQIVSPLWQDRSHFGQVANRWYFRKSWAGLFNQSHIDPNKPQYSLANQQGIGEVVIFARMNASLNFEIKGALIEFPSRRRQSQ